jgi:hypothetical protein
MEKSIMKKFLVGVFASIAAFGTASLGAYAGSPELVGESVPVASASSVNRTIVVDSRTKWVNVTQGETVKFVINGREIVFAFDGQPGTFDLRQIVPAETLDHSVMVYVESNFVPD